MSDENDSINDTDDDVEGHFMPGGRMGEDLGVPRNGADERPRRAVPADDDDEDDVAGHRAMPQTGQAPHELDRQRD